MNLPSRSGGGKGTFFFCCLALALAALLLVGSNLAVILFRGLRSLPVCIRQAEALFAVGLSVRCASVSTTLCFLLALPTAWVLTRPDLPLRGAAEIILELTMSLPNIVLGLSLLILFSLPFGRALKDIGFPVVFNRNGIILAQLTVNLPFAVKLCATALRTVDGKLERIAGLLGASPGRRFFTVLLPCCRHSLISAVILVWARALGEFGASLMLVGVTRMKTETLPGSIFLNVSTNDLDAALASAFILLLLNAAALLIDSFIRHREKGRSRYG